MEVIFNTDKFKVVNIGKKNKEAIYYSEAVNRLKVEPNGPLGKYTAFTTV